IGAGVQLSANGMRILIELGVGDEIARIGANPTSKEVRLWNSGNSRRFIDLGATSVQKFGAPFHAVHRADLQNVLLAAARRAPPEAVRVGARCDSFEQDGTGVVARLSDGRTAAGDVLVGADGIHSKTRQTLFGPDKVKFSGFMAWRSLVDTAGLPESISRT